MRRILTIALALTFCLAMSTAMAAYPPSAWGTLYEQEGTPDDGYPAIDASGQSGCATMDEANRTNWKYQYGGTSTWSGIFHGGAETPWVAEEGEWPPVQIEADIEMFCEYSMTDPNIYFHLGNIYSATAADKTATISGSFTSNNGQHIGISFQGTDKPDEAFDLNTGVIKGGMVGTVDCLNRDISDEAFDIRIRLSWGSGYQPPSSYSGSSHPLGMTHTLFWLVNAGEPGTYPLTWEFTLMPETDQADGNYNLDPAIVVVPVL